MLADILRIEIHRREAVYRFLHRFGRLLLEEQARAAVFDRLGRAAFLIGDDRPSGRHRFDDGDAEVLFLRIDERFAVLEQPHLFRFGNAAEELDVRSAVGDTAQALEVDAVAEHLQRQAEVAEGLDDDVGPLILREPSADQEIFPRSVAYGILVDFDRRIDDDRIALVIFLDPGLDRLRVGDEEIDAVGRLPVPEADVIEDEGDDFFEILVIRQFFDVLVRIIPDIPSRRMAVADMERIRAGDDAFGERRGVGDDEVEAAEVEEFDGHRHERHVPLVMLDAARELLDDRRLDAAVEDLGHFRFGQERVDRSRRIHVSQDAQDLFGAAVLGEMVVDEGDPGVFHIIQPRATGRRRAESLRG